MFGDGALGREICGDEEGILALPRETIRAFWSATYRPSNIVVAIAGDLDHATALDLVAADLRDRQRGRRRRSRPRPTLPAGPTYLRGDRDTAQAHICLAVPAYRRDHPDSWTLGVLNGLLGEGMSSRLFLAVREELGLAYDVGSGITEYADSGALGVYAGVDPDRLEPALEAILAELATAARRAGPARGARQGEGLPVGRARAADGRHPPPRLVDRRPGGAPRAGPDARRGARGDRRGDRRRHPAGGRRAVPRRRCCGWPSSRRAATGSVSTGPSGCRADRSRPMTGIDEPANGGGRRGRRGRPRSWRAEARAERRAAGRAPARPAPPADRLARPRPGRARDAWPGRARSTTRRCSTSPRSAGGPTT